MTTVLFAREANARPALGVHFAEPLHDGETEAWPPELLDLARRDAPAGQDDPVEDGREDIEATEDRSGEGAALQLEMQKAPDERPSPRPWAGGRGRPHRASWGDVAALPGPLDDDDQPLRKLPELFSPTTHAVAADDAGR